MTTYTIYDSLLVNAGPIGLGLYLDEGGSSIGKSVPDSATTWRFNTTNGLTYLLDLNLSSSFPVNFVDLTTTTNLDILTASALKQSPVGSTLNVTAGTQPTTAYNSMDSPAPQTGVPLELFRINISGTRSILITVVSGFKTNAGVVPTTISTSGTIFVSFVASNTSGSTVANFFDLHQWLGAFSFSTVTAVINGDGSISIVGNVGFLSDPTRTHDWWSAMIDIVPI